ncbi:MAG: sigma-70 family RNA polymerase sigma factor [Phycisphaerales bacterium]
MQRAHDRTSNELTKGVDQTPLVVLLREMHRGDEDAAAKLWRAISPRLIAYARVATNRDGTDDAEDLVQKVFCNVLSMRSSKLSEVHDVFAFFVVSLRRAVIDARRRAARKRTFLSGIFSRFIDSDADDTSFASTVSLPRQQSQENDNSELFKALSVIDADLRDIVLLKHVAGLTFEQMSLATNEPRSTVAVKYQRAIVLLRKHLCMETNQVMPAAPLAERAAVRTQTRISTQAGGAPCQ